MCDQHRLVRGLASLVLFAGLFAASVRGQAPSQGGGERHEPQMGIRANLGLLGPMATLQDSRGKRASSWDRSGRNQDWITVHKHERKVLMEETGAGCIKHIYWTYGEGDEKKRMNIFRGVVLRMYWDGSDVPSVEVPLGDFFGVTNGVVRPMRSLAFTTNPGEGGEGLEAQGSWGFNCYVPMPFVKGARVEVENTGDSDFGWFWYHIDYEAYETASAIPPEVGRLHACWHRENPTQAIPVPPPADPKQPVVENANLTGKDNYVILDAEGDGQFVGYFMTVVNLQKHWWGEGDDMIFIDGESFPPSYHGTGTEEIFSGGACPASEYFGPYTGFHRIENRSNAHFFGSNGMYRFYICDPIRFRKSIRVTIEHGHANDHANDYSSVAFWYQREPNHKRAPLPPLDQRLVHPDPAE